MKLQISKIIKFLRNKIYKNKFLIIAILLIIIIYYFYLFYTILPLYEAGYLKNLEVSLLNNNKKKISELKLIKKLNCLLEIYLNTLKTEEFLFHFGFICFSCFFFIRL